MRRILTLTAALSACAADPEPVATIDTAPPPPAPIVPPACAPGSAFELNGVAFTDLQRACDAATRGDTVVLCAGRHTIGDVQVYEDGITLAGETGDPADVTLVGGTISMQPYNLPVPPGTVQTASGFTLDGAELYGASSEAFHVADLRFTGAGSKLYIETDSAYVYRTEFRNGTGGLMLEVGAYQAEVNLSLDEVRFQDNVVDDNLVWVHNRDSTPAPGRVRMRDVDWINNTSTAAYAPLGLFTDDLQVEIIGGHVVGNQNPNASIIELFGARGPSRIRDWTVTDNVVGYPTVNIVGEFEPLSIRDSAFLRNDWPTAPFSVGSALLVEGPTARLTNVDFGAGADTNEPADIATCGVDYGVVTGRTIRYPSRCPR